MKLNEIIRCVSSVYPDNYIADVYWDFIKQQPVHDAAGGDGLAEFIANELHDTYDPTASTDAQARDAIRVLDKAAQELLACSRALGLLTNEAKPWMKRQAKVKGKPRGKK